MNALDPINLTIEFVKQQVDPGGGGEFVNAQTGDVAIWAILAILFVGVIAYCMFTFSRVFNGQFATATLNAKHAKNARGGGRLATTKAILIAAVVGLIACLSITTTTALAQSQKNNIDFKPDKIQVIVNEETGEATCDAFNFVNNTNDYYIFTKSTLNLTDAAAEVSTEEDWDVTLNASGLNADLFTGQPGDYTIDYNAIKTLYPGGTSNATFTFNKFDKEIAKKLIGKQVFSLTLIPADNIVKVPAAETGLVYDGTEKIGVKGGAGYTLTGNTGTNASDNYVATATLISTDLIWPDKTKDPKEITWSISKAEGEFNKYPAARSLTYNGESQALVDAGTDSYGADVVYKTAGMAEYSTNIPVAKDANTYIVYAHVVADDNHFQSSDYIVNDAYIAQNVIKSITIQGSCNDKDYAETGTYTFPYYDGGETAYEVESYELIKPAISGLVSASNITPKDKYEIPAIEVPCWDVGSHEFSLQGYNWQYSDSNIITNSDTVWDVRNGNLQINEKKAVKISVSASPEKAKINDTVTYTVKLTNKIEEAVTGKIQLNTDASTALDVNLDPLGEVTKTMTYEVKDSDFLYPSLVNVITFSATIDEVPYIVYDSISTAFEYKFAVAPSFETPFNYTGSPIKPFESVTQEGYDFVVGDGSVIEATDAGIYSTLIVLRPGYHWTDQSESISRLIDWAIKPIDVNVCFDVEDTGYTTTYGEKWDATTDTAITFKHSLPMPEGTTLEQILGGVASAECIYRRGYNAGEYTVSLNLPPKTGWNSNYNISSTNSKLIVDRRTLYLTWQKELVYNYEVQYPNISYTGQYGQDEISFIIESYSDPLHTIPAAQQEPGKYYDIAIIDGAFNKNNYVIADGQDSETIVIRSSPTGLTPKAVLTEPHFSDPNNYSLNFVYDDLTYTEGEGGVIKVYGVIETSYDGPSNNGNVLPLWHADNQALYLTTKVVFQPSFKNFTTFVSGNIFNGMQAWFADMPHLRQVEGFENVNTSNVNVFLMNGIFANAGSSNLNMDLSNLSFAGKSELEFACSYMFYNSYYEEIKMFSSSKQTKIIINGVTSHMFDSCVLRRLDMPCSISEIENAEYMFYNCHYIESINIYNWSINSNASLNCMFGLCSNLNKISCKVGTDWSIDFTGNSTNMFAGCNKLPHFNEIVGSAEPNITFAKGCNSTNWQTVNGLFSEPLEKDDGKAMIGSNGILQFYVSGEIEAVDEEMSVPVNGENIPWTASPELRNSIKNIKSTENFQLWLGMNVTSTKGWFKQLNSVIAIDVTNWNTKLVTDMSEMFKECGKLSYVNIKGLNTSMLENMSHMFNGCNYLSKIDGIDVLNVSSVNDMSYLFYSTNLVTFDGTNWNVSNVENFSYMFALNRGLAEIDLSKWNVSNGKTFEWMFGGCRSMLTINIQNFNLSSKANNVDYMFGNCSTLRNIFCDYDWRNLSLTSLQLFWHDYGLPNFDPAHTGIEKAYKGSGGYFS